MDRTVFQVGCQRSERCPLLDELAPVIHFEHMSHSTAHQSQSTSYTISHPFNFRDHLFMARRTLAREPRALKRVL